MIRLNSKTNDVIVKTKPYAEMLYWGKSLKQFDKNYPFERALHALRIDEKAPFKLSPEEGVGNFSSPGLEGNRNGYDWSPIFETVEVKEESNSVTIICEDKAAGLRLTHVLKMDDNGVLQAQNSLTNLSAEPYSLQRLAVTLPLPERAKELMAFHGRWIKEWQPHRAIIDHCGYIQENRRGRTSHEYFPGMVMGTKGFSEQNGEVWGIHLAWSGNHRIQAAVKSDGRCFIQAEALYLSGEVTLAQNETVSTPWVYATYSNNGLNGMSQQFHQFVREHIVKFHVKKARPVHLNTWEGIYFDHNPEHIMDMATKSAQIGVERFIIDDGWFGRRDDDTQALGDWYLDERKYPNGLEPVIKHVKDLGMEFGIWVEPEMINKNSDLYRSHPDWLLALPDYVQSPSRNQHVLNLQNPAVFEYLLERLTWLLSSYDIDYIKWDMNREIVQPGHEGKPSAVGQANAVYRLMDILQEKFPHVEIESCSSGGGRIDYEILKRTQRFWSSDSNDALERQTIQKGMSYFFPPEVMGAHIGNPDCHTTFRKHDINFRGLTALAGHMGVELDPVKMPEEEQQGFAHYIKLHKQLRDLLHSGKTVRLDMDDPETMFGYGVVSQDQSEAVFTVAQLKMPTYALCGGLRPAGLNEAKQYRVEVLDMSKKIDPQFSRHTMKKLPEWMTKQTVVSGEYLQNAGLPMPILDPESAILIKFTSM